MIRRPPLLRCLVPLLALLALPAAEPGADAALAERAKARVEEGKAALARYRDGANGDQRQLLNAARAFDEAQELFAKAKDDAAHMEAQASLFWCRKQMNMATAKEYVSRRGTPLPPPRAEPRAEEPADAAQEPAAQPAPAAQPVRVLGPPPVVRDPRQTRFERPLSTPPAVRAPLPEAAAAKAAAAEVRRTYAKALRRTSSTAKRALAHRLLAEAAARAWEPAQRHALLAEALRLGQEGDAPDVVIDAAVELAARFAGFDAAAEIRQALGRMPDRALGAAVLTLLEKPRDPAANAVAGRAFAIELDRWGEAVPMLALGDEADFARAADLELAPGSAPAAVGDAWYELSRRPNTRSTDRFALLRHALAWYRRAQPGLDAAARPRIDQRIAEIDKVLPLDPDSLDWDLLTPGQWDKLKGRIVTVQARIDRTDPSVILAAGEPVRLVPHPAETWSLLDVAGKEYQCGWQGAQAITKRPARAGALPRLDLAEGALLAWIDNGNPGPAFGILQGPGRLFLCANRPPAVPVAKGQIRVKLVAVREDEDGE